LSFLGEASDRGWQKIKQGHHLQSSEENLKKSSSSSMAGSPPMGLSLARLGCVEGLLTPFEDILPTGSPL